MLGDRLSAGRERAGLTRAQLAEKLHLGEGQVRALEEGQVENLPEPVFVRARVRAIAKALGLDANELTALLPDELRGASALPASSSRSSSSRAREAQRPKAALSRSPDPSPQEKLKSALGWLMPLLGLLAGTWWVRYNEFVGSAPKTASLPEPPTSAPASAPAATLGPDIAGIIRVQPASGRPSWVAIRHADGSMLFEGLLSEVRTLPSGEGVQVCAGRPDLVEAGFSVDSMRPLGTIESVRWVSLDELVQGTDP